MSDNLPTSYRNIAQFDMLSSANLWKLNQKRKNIRRHLYFIDGKVERFQVDSLLGKTVQFVQNGEK